MGDDLYDDKTYIYITAFYFVTVTATTVGYGDFSGTTNEERLFLIFLEFAGICIFSIISKNIQNLKSTKKITEIVTDKKEEIQEYIYSIDKILPELPMDPYFYDSTTEYIETSFMFGIIQSFKKDKFYKNLSANLKNRLVHVVLNQYYFKF